MSIEALSEQPKKLDFIALSFIEHVADDYSYEIAVIHQDSSSWEIQLQCPVLGEASMGVSLHETSVFISEAVKSLVEKYPTHDWKNMISLTTYNGAFRIKFEAK